MYASYMLLLLKTAQAICTRMTACLHTCDDVKQHMAEQEVAPSILKFLSPVHTPPEHVLQDRNDLQSMVTSRSCCGYCCHQRIPHLSMCCRRRVTCTIWRPLRAVVVVVFWLKIRQPWQGKHKSVHCSCLTECFHAVLSLLWATCFGTQHWHRLPRRS